jgi:hypothetical protein
LPFKFFADIVGIAVWVRTPATEPPRFSEPGDRHR